jgi:hypothetical protein
VKSTWKVKVPHLMVLWERVADLVDNKDNFKVIPHFHPTPKS